MPQAAIHIDSFGGVRPRVGSKLLRPLEAQIAENCRLLSGELGAWRRPSNVFPVGHNYLVWSNQFQQSIAWVQSGLVDVQVNQTNAPDGTLTADKLRESAVNNAHRVTQTINKPAIADYYTAAVSMKAAERNFGEIRVISAGGQVQAIINLTTGAVTSEFTTGTFSEREVFVESETNGFWRVHLGAKTSTDTTISMVVGISSDGTQFNYLGTLNSGIFIDGASLRKSDRPGPYRETLATALINDPSTIYGFRDTWFVFNEIANLVAAPFGSDTVDTTYYTRASGDPRVTYSPIAEDASGSGDRPRNSFSMGLPVPANPPLATLNSVSGSITSAVSQIASAGAAATAAYTFAGVITDGTPVKLKVHCKVTVSTLANQQGRVRFVVTRNTLAGEEIGAIELTQDFNPEGGSPDVKVFEQQFEVEDSPNAGTHTWTVTTTVALSAGGAFTPTYAHNGGTIRYSETNVGSTAHGLVVGDLVSIANVVGMEAINTNQVAVTRVPDANHFYIDKDSDGQTYSSGGTWTLVFEDEDITETAYVFTWLSTVGGKVLEGPPSAPSNIVARGDGQRVALSAIDIIAPADGGNYNFSGKRIYRTNLRSDLGANYQFVAEIAVGTSSYNDSVRDIALGEVLPSTDWIKPPNDMFGLVELSNGVLAGISGNEVCICEPYQPHAWPTKYRQLCFNKPKALVGTGGSLVVLTEGKPHFIHGTVPGEMGMVKVERVQPCLSARGAVDMGYGALYTGDDGVASLSSGSSDVVTRDYFTKEEWNELNPPSHIAGEYDDRYVCFFTKVDGTQGGFILDPFADSARVTMLNFGASAVWTNPKTGDFYALIDEYIAKWDAADDWLDFRWRSKTFRVPPVNMSWLKVISSEYPVTVDIYANKDPARAEALDLVDSIDVTDARPVRLPADYIATLFELELRGNGEGRVSYVGVATSLAEIENRA